MSAWVNVRRDEGQHKVEVTAQCGLRSMNVCVCEREGGVVIDGARLSIISAEVGKLSLQPFAQGPPTHIPSNELQAG